MRRHSLLPVLAFSLTVEILPIGEYDVDRRDGALAYVLDGETTDAPRTLVYVDAEDVGNGLCRLRDGAGAIRRGGCAQTVTCCRH